MQRTEPKLFLGPLVDYEFTRYLYRRDAFGEGSARWPCSRLIKLVRLRNDGTSLREIGEMMGGLSRETIRGRLVLLLKTYRHFKRLEGRGDADSA